MKKRKFKNLSIKELGDQKKQSLGMICFLLTITGIYFIISIFVLRKMNNHSSVGIAVILFIFTVFLHKFKELKKEIALRQKKQPNKGV